MSAYPITRLRWLSFCCVVGLFFWGCGKQEKDAVQGENVPESFQFMDVGANTVMDSGVRDRLRAALGSYATNPRSTIDLELKYKGFLKAYYPDLAGLNQRLNVNDVVRKEYPATRLTFRNTREHNTVFDYVEFIYGHASGCPLLIKMNTKKEISGLIDTVKDKYGPPEKIPISEGKSWSLSWRKNEDVFVIARITGRYDRPEYHMLIVYANRLERLLARSGNGEPQNGKGAGKVF
ncbi:MAG: hypothetical protein ACLFUL_02650 [Desulfobacteraceae bacterium]